MRRERKSEMGPTPRRKVFCGKCPWVERSSNCVDRRLINAAKRSDLEGLQSALADGGRLGAKDEDGKGVLEIVREKGNAKMLDYLTRHVLSESARPINGTFSGQFEKVTMEELVDDTPKCADGRLLAAAKAGKFEDVLAALVDGADMDVRDDRGMTALGIAMGDNPGEYRYPKIVSHLNILRMQSRCITPDSRLLSAVRSGDLNGVKDALKKGASLDARDEKGRTPLELARSLEHTGVWGHLSGVELARKKGL